MMPLLIRIFVYIACSFAPLWLVAPVGSVAATSHPTVVLASATNDTGESTATTDTTELANYGLENEPSQCIGFLPKPNCGKKPEDAGERGGALQYTVFGVMMFGLGIVVIGIARSTRRQKPQQ